MSLSKCKCCYSNNCLHFFKCAVPLRLGKNKLEHLQALFQCHDTQHCDIQNYDDTLHIGLICVSKNDTQHYNSLPWLLLCWVPLCWVSLCWVSLCWVSWHIFSSFVPGKLFQPSLMFTGRARAYTNGVPFRSPLNDWLLDFPTNIRLSWKCLTGTNALAYYEKF
jgi:hypothetical protein